MAKMCTVPLSEEQQIYLSSDEKLMQYIVAGSFPRRNSYNWADDFAVSNTRIRVPVMITMTLFSIHLNTENELPSLTV